MKNTYQVPVAQLIIMNSQDVISTSETALTENFVNFSRLKQVDSLDI